MRCTMRFAAAALALSLASANPFLSHFFRSQRERHWEETREAGRALVARHGLRIPPDQWFNQTLDHFNVSLMP
jgi:hypothetical protein